MSNGNYTVLDLPKILKCAREQVCLGFYPESLTIYKNCLKIIEK